MKSNQQKRNEARILFMKIMNKSINKQKKIKLCSCKEKQIQKEVNKLTKTT